MDTLKHSNGTYSKSSGETTAPHITPEFANNRKQRRARLSKLRKQKKLKVKLKNL